MKSNKEYLEEIYLRKEEVANTKKKDEFYNITFKDSKYKVLKIAATFVMVLGVTFGTIYAGKEAYQNIWQDPKKYSYSISQDLSDEEKQECISEEEANELGNKYLKQVGLEDEKILNQNLSKEFLSDKNEWGMSSKIATMTIDAKTGDLKTIQVPTWNYKIPYNYGISREEAKEVAYQLFDKIKEDNIEGDYELVTLRRNMETDEASYIWYSEFQRKYGDLINPNESVFIGWVPTINGIYQIKIQRDKFENNEIVKTKEEAIEIAKEKDRKVAPERTIKNIDADIRIEKMNAEVYLRENKKEDYENGKILKEDGVYKTEERVRRVWLVNIEYEKQEDKMDSFTYFVDTTTGEIIGGAMYDPRDSEETIKNDPNNLI